ncbi:MAG: cysteine desulfurase-like protein [Bacteroidota bacterium]
MLQVEQIRSFFPSLSGDWVFMDNAGGSQTAKPVVDRLSDYLLSSNVQHGASYAVSQEAGRRVDEATAAMATYVNAAHPKEIVMGGSTTLLIRILSLTLGQTFEPGDEIIVTNTDHEANVSPWTDLKAKGLKVHVWRVRPDTLELDLDDLAELMNDKTRLVAVSHTSNVLGTLQPIKEIAAFVHARGALICVDGVAHAPHRLVDVQDLDVDFYIFSFYKVYGTHFALMYGKQEHWSRLPGINHYFINGENFPYKFQPGNVNFELAYGMLGLIDYLEAAHDLHFPNQGGSQREKLQRTFDLFSAYEEQLSQKLITYLRNKSAVRIIGSPDYSQDKRVATVSFVVENTDSESIVLAVDKHQIGIRFGDFYAKKLIHDLGLEAQNGVVRVSMVHYNTLEEVDRLIAVFESEGLLEGNVF